MQPLPPLLGIVGHSGAGKTTLIERLVPRLRARDLRVGVLKHDAHRVELDKKGKDSYRLRESGADAVGLASREFCFVTTPVQPVAGPEELVRRLFAGIPLDLVLVEGFTAHSHPKVEVVHPERGPRAAPRQDRVVAWMLRRPSPVPADLATLHADDVDGLVRLLARRGLLPSARRLATA